MVGKAPDWYVTINHKTKLCVSLPMLMPLYLMTFSDICGTFHFAKQCDKDLYDGGNGHYPAINTTHIDYSADYHIFAVEWNTTSIKWFVDDHHYHTRTQDSVMIPQWPFYVILNTAISWWVPPDTAYPQYHYIDYVRLYKEIK